MYFKPPEIAVGAVLMFAFNISVIGEPMVVEMVPAFALLIGGDAAISAARRRLSARGDD